MFNERKTGFTLVEVKKYLNQAVFVKHFPIQVLLCVVVCLLAPEVNRQPIYDSEVQRNHNADEPVVNLEGQQEGYMNQQGNRQIQVDVFGGVNFHRVIAPFKG